MNVDPLSAEAQARAVRFIDRMTSQHEALRLVFDAIPWAILLEKEDGEVVLCNTMTASNMGMTPEEVEGKHVAELPIPGELVSLSAESTRKALALGVGPQKIPDYVIRFTPIGGVEQQMRVTKVAIQVNGECLLLAMAQPL